MFNPQVFYEAGRTRSGVALLPVNIVDTTYMPTSIFLFSTRNANYVIERDGYAPRYINSSKYQYPNSSDELTFSNAFIGSIRFKFLGGLQDVFSINLYSFHASYSHINIQDFRAFINQFPKLEVINWQLYIGNGINGYANTRNFVIKGNLAHIPKSVKRFHVERLDGVVNQSTDIYLNISEFPIENELEYLNFKSSAKIKLNGDLSKIGNKVNLFSIGSVYEGSSITYTAGKTWAHNLETLSIPLPLSHTELDNLLIDLQNSVTSVGPGTIALGGVRSAASDAAVAYLQGLGRTVNVASHNVFQKILDLPFQNSFADVGEMGMTMVSGGTSNQPTFALSGRKTGEYCAVFNGSQSIKTTTNLPINSDKVTIAFWIKSTMSALLGLILETNGNNGFVVFKNVSADSLLFIDINAGSENRVANNSSLSTWTHVVMTIDRNLGVDQNKIFINGVLSFTQKTTHYNNLNGNLSNLPLFIGQRNGSTNGFEGSLTRLKIYNYPLAPSEVSNLYNSEL